jgi:hypothetical protein
VQGKRCFDVPGKDRKNSRFYVQFVHAGCFITTVAVSQLVLAGFWGLSVAL